MYIAVANGEKESFARAANFVKMPHKSKEYFIQQVVIKCHNFFVGWWYNLLNRAAFFAYEKGEKCKIFHLVPKKRANCPENLQNWMKTRKNAIKTRQIQIATSMQFHEGAPRKKG